MKEEEQLVTCWTSSVPHKRIKWCCWGWKPADVKYRPNTVVIKK